MIKAFFEIDTWSGNPNGLHVVCFPGDMQNTVPHWQSSPEIVLVLEGCLDVTVEGRFHHLEQFDFITINSGEIHSTLNEAKNGIQVIFTVDEELFRRPGLQFQFATVGEGALQRDTSDAWMARLCLIQICRLKRSVGLRPTSDEDRSDENWYEIRRWLYQLLGVMTRHTIDKDQKGTALPKAFLDCISLIHTEYSSHLTAELVAKRAYISRAKLFRLFSTYLGVGFTEYLNMVRLQKACTQLINSEESVAEIAENNGFSSLSNFYVYFKRMFGTTPQKYREDNLHGPQESKAQHFRLLNQFGIRRLEDEDYKRYISFFETMQENA